MQFLVTALFLEKLWCRSKNGYTFNSPAKRSGKALFYIVATSFSSKSPMLPEISLHDKLLDEGVF